MHITNLSVIYNITRSNLQNYNEIGGLQFIKYYTKCQKQPQQRQFNSGQHFTQILNSNFRCDISCHDTRLVCDERENV